MWHKKNQFKRVVEWKLLLFSVLGTKQLFFQVPIGYICAELEPLSFSIKTCILFGLTKYYVHVFGGYLEKVNYTVSWDAEFPSFMIGLLELLWHSTFSSSREEAKKRYRLVFQQPTGKVPVYHSGQSGLACFISKSWKLQLLMPFDTINLKTVNATCLKFLMSAAM
jgi:hypothetical protein